MSDQTTLHDCEFCGESATARRELRPEVWEKGRRLKAAVKVWVCPTHADRIESQRGWQGRTVDQSRRHTRAAKERLKRTQERLW